MMYFAIQVCPDGGTIRDADTAEPRTVEVGEFECKQDAVNQACSQLECRQLFLGVIRKLQGQGGYVVLNAQEHADV